MRIRFIQDYKSYKIGEVVVMKYLDANKLVSKGYAIMDKMMGKETIK